MSSYTIDSNVSSLPVYYQLYIILQRAMRDCRLRGGERFPSEETLAAQFGVSRPTASRAVQELIAQGYLARKRGLGTFVEELVPSHLSLLDSSLSFSDELGLREDHSTEFVRRALLKALGSEAAVLGIPEGASIVYLRRLHMIRGRVVMLCDSRLPAERFPGLESRRLFGNSLLKTLERDYGCTVRQAKRCVEATEVLDPEVAGLLRIPRFAPIILMTGLAFDGAFAVVESMTAYVKEGVAFENVVVGSQGATGRQSPPLASDPC